MNAQIKVPVAVPAYNLQNELKKCVSSIEKQMHSNIEIILVNDGSIKAGMSSAIWQKKIIVLFP